MPNVKARALHTSINEKVSKNGNERIEESQNGVRGNLFVSLFICNALFHEAPSHIARCIFFTKDKTMVVAVTLKVN